ncbi:HSP20-like chaperone [Apiosordaria backusii]|uniref:HSP20-like chaperone n=1 Tax=Apiosordaria backusii TaxID=314023 RepID=A0AA40BKK0_9PEZI|nr:HSP20-like chaperone [Apiosordaria backusii]
MPITFPSDLYTTDPNFTTLFRLLDDFETYSREVQDEAPSQVVTSRPAGGGGGGRHRARGPRPRFDIRETPKSYELYGEVPGIDRKNIHIELTQENVLLIRGHIDRPYETGTSPAAQQKGEEKEKEKKEGEKQKGKEEEKKEEKKEEEKKEDVDENVTVRYLLKERFVGDFCREFSFPGPLQELDIGASLEGGILKVVAPKQQVAKGGRKIEIQ